MLGTFPNEHKEGCPYLKWYNDNARWQPGGPLSEIVREIVVEEECTCILSRHIEDHVEDIVFSGEDDFISLPQNKHSSSHIGDRRRK